MSVVNQYDVLVVRFAQRTTTATESYYRYSVYGEPERTFTMSYYFWVLRSANGETIVVDTGFSEGSARERGRVFDIRPAEALAELGIAPRDVGTVVLSHLHWDHTGNVDAFPNARVVLDRVEWDFWTSRYGAKRAIACSSSEADMAVLRRVEAEGRLDLVDAHPEFALADGVVLSRLGGHTPGSAAVVVERATGPIVIAGDIVHYEDEITEDRPFNVMTNLCEMYDAYEYLREAQARGAIVLAGHDSAVFERFAPVDGSAHAVAVR